MKKTEQHKAITYSIDWDMFSRSPANNAQLNRDMLAKARGFEEKQFMRDDIYKIVCDANFLWDITAFYLRKSEGEEYLIELSLAGFCELHAPVWLLKEMAASVFEPMARQLRVSTYDLRAIFEEFVAPHIIFHEGYEPSKSIVYPVGVDPKDVPYTELARDIDALGVVSYDKDIEALLTRRLDSNFVEVATRIARIENGVVQAKLAGFVGINIAGHIVTEGSKSLANTVRKVPPPVLAGISAIAILGGYLYLRDENRRRNTVKRIKKVTPALSIAGKAIWEGVEWTQKSEQHAQTLRRTLEEV